MKNSGIPNWIRVVSLLMCALGIFVGCSLYVSPGTFIQDVDFTSSSVRSLASMWGARQIALASIIGYSAVRKSIPMLQISLAGYALMNVQDLVIGFLRGDLGLTVGATLFALGPAYMIYHLARIKIRAEKDRD